ncbi:putative lipid II flippase FtsW, partial [Micrococcus sp. RIT608]|uniref:putative lipid II flippase FtsW n=1 Tax=Micrococcus sp. RIT608 TaxID=2487139 RepID=UPI000F44F712
MSPIELRPVRPRAADDAPEHRERILRRMWRVLEGRRALDLSVLLISGCTALLTVLGLVMVLSSSSVEAIGTGGGSYALFLRQSAWAVAGVAALLVFSRLPVRVLKALAWPAFGVAVILLALVAFSPLGVTVGGNRNWLGIGGFRMQPSEAAKLALALWAAAVLERKHRLVTQVRHALIPVLPGGLLLLILVMAGSDLGTAIILAIVLATVLYVAGTHWGVFLTFLALSMLGILALTLLAPHRMVRVQAWMGDCSDATDPCFQPAHGMYALASGGWWGAGLGQSRQKWSYIPEAENDFIFTILGEELGLVGTLVVLLAYLGLAIGIYRVAAGTTSTFIRLSTWGILAWLVGQAAVNIAMVSGIIPVVGVPLPFISYGGSALTLSLSAVGIVLAFARHERRRA